ncbi:MAG: hypothetical protein HY680_04425 [Chloroflexi bacterium]|nr:hypothetical protein [Chloroflexota bacterium]
MTLVEEALRLLKGKQVVVVTSLESDGFLQEIVGELLDGGDGYLVVKQAEEESPTVINTAFVAWIYEETEEEEDT